MARENPDGTKKILRKSYKGIMKRLGISGAFDAVAKDIAAPDSLSEMMKKPAEYFNQEFTAPKRSFLEVDGSKASFPDDLLKRAYDMRRGPIPKDIWSPKVLGTEFMQAPAAPTAQAKVNNYSGSRTPTHQAGGVQRKSKDLKPEASRPQRKPKRSYDDSSFAGYDVKYDDDEVADPGYSTGGDGEDKMGARKRPKKVCSVLHAEVVPY